MLVGILTDVFPVETTASFSKRVFWLKEPDTERYPQHWEIELHGEETRRILDVKIGDRLQVEVQVRGRKYQKKDRSQAIFTSLKCVGLKLLEQIEVSQSYKGNAHDKAAAQANAGKLPLQ